MNADGTNLVNLGVKGGRPSWSPDGKKIAFGLSSQIVTSDIYVMSADGSNPILLTNHEVNNWNQVWSSDSTKIAFISERDGDQEIYVINVDGSNLVRLTNNESNDYSPVWSP
jgi:Tol biopolymer transport system component